MGNINTSSQMSNFSKRNVRVFISEKALEIDAFLAPRAEGDGQMASVLSGGKKQFVFRDGGVDGVACVRVLASQTQHVPWDAQRFLSVFVEDEDDEGVCAKQIMHNMALSGPVTVLLYDL